MTALPGVCEARAVPALLIEQVRAYARQADLSVLQRAYDFSARAHAGQKRCSGEPYISHPFEVATILAQLRMDVASICAGLLHDVIEDTACTSETLEREFGPEITKLVEGVTQISKIMFRNWQEKQAENFRKMLLYMAADLRVLLIKLADRLHNVRTLEALSEPQRIAIAKETLEIYAPLAHRLGISWIKAEMEELCFSCLEPDAYRNLSEKVAEGRVQREDYLEGVMAEVRATMEAEHLPGRIQGRPKQLYSLHQKMQQQEIAFEEIHDLMGVRVITDTAAHCYALLGMVHALWVPVPGRFKDYIAMPKSNRYQSLHTTVVGPQGRRVECQIRTEQMHCMAQDGVAAHWAYKEHSSAHLHKKEKTPVISPQKEPDFAWLRQLLEWGQEMSDTRQFMDSVKMDLSGGIIYVFTPKGEVKEMVRGATPVDFAYAVHTEVGHRCMGAKINSRIAPLSEPLRNGDMIEILTSPSHRPSKDWLKFVKTTRARTKIKHLVREEEHARSVEIGKRLLERGLRQAHLTASGLLKSPAFTAKAREMGIHTQEDLFSAVGYGKISARKVLRLLEVAPTKEGTVKAPPALIGSYETPVRVGGDLSNCLVHFSKCCNPVLGDPIIGFVTYGRGLSIHTTHCANLARLTCHAERLIEVEWEVEREQRETTGSGQREGGNRHCVAIAVRTLDRPGMLASVSAAISASGVNIQQAKIVTTPDRKATLQFQIGITDIKHLERTLMRIRALSDVLAVSRVRSI